MTGQALIVQGDALHLPLPDASVDLVVTSPPYWALRSYSAGPGEIGSEPTPQAFLEALWAATAEMMRVLKPTGSMFVDLGDKYATAFGPNSNTGKTNWSAPGSRYDGSQRSENRSFRGTGIREKSLMLLPERYRVGCVDRLGLIARAVLVWNKPNGLPESVTDRVRRSHEDWVHLVKSPRYYSATDEIREPHSAEASGRRALYGQNGRGTETSVQVVRHDGGENGVMGFSANPLGKLPGSVWTIPSEPLRLPDHLGVQHYAAFPSEWPRRLILGWSPPGICVECGQGRVPVVERSYPHDRPNKRPLPERLDRQGTIYSHTRPSMGDGQMAATILGYACSCTPFTDHPGTGEFSGVGQIGRADNPGRYPNTGEGWEPSPSGKGGLGDRPKVGPWREWHLDRWTPPPTRPAIILDPFGGTGTTAMVAKALGRIGVSVDLSHAYGRAARWRVTHDGAKAISRTNLERQGSLL